MKKIIHTTAGVACLPLIMTIIFIVVFTVSAVLGLAYVLSKLDMNSMPDDLVSMLNEGADIIIQLLRHVDA